MRRRKNNERTKCLPNLTRDRTSYNHLLYCRLMYRKLTGIPDTVQVLSSYLSRAKPHHFTGKTDSYTATYTCVPIPVSDVWYAVACAIEFISDIRREADRTHCVISIYEVYYVRQRQRQLWKPFFNSLIAQNSLMPACISSACCALPFEIM